MAAPSYPDFQIKEWCRVRSDLTEFRPVKRTGADGKPFYRIYYNLVVRTNDANLKFSLEVEGEEMGSVEATYT